MTNEKMNTDYTYCMNDDTCIHRRGCKRWVGNYTDSECKELCNAKYDLYIYDRICIKNKYNMLDRFRNSDGSEA